MGGRSPWHGSYLCGGGAALVCNDELLRIKDPRLITKLLKLKQAAGIASKRISAVEMQHVIATHRQDAAAGTLGVVSSTISGNLNTLAVGIYEEVRQ